jgi:hypothetical protein
LRRVAIANRAASFFSSCSSDWASFIAVVITPMNRFSSRNAENSTATAPEYACCERNQSRAANLDLVRTIDTEVDRAKLWKGLVLACYLVVSDIARVVSPLVAAEH